MRKRQILFVAIHLLLLLTPPLQLQAKFKRGSLYYEVISFSSLQVAVVSQNTVWPYWDENEKPKGAVDIPTTIEDAGETYTVTSIGANALIHCDKITAVTIPNSVTSIGDAAFSGCSKLETVTSLIENVGEVTMGRDIFKQIPFKYCKLFVPDGKEDAYRTAEEWKNFKLIRPLSSKGRFGVGDKFKAKNLYFIAISTSPSRVAVAPQYKGENLPFWDENEEPEGTVDIPTTVEHDGITYSVTSIDERAFMYCSKITTVTIPNSVTRIDECAFMFCSEITTVTIPNSVTSIGDHAFFGCDHLEFVTIPNSVTSIGGSAFFGCNHLEFVTIPNSVTSIGDHAFAACNALTYLDVAKDNPNYSSLDGVLFNKNQSTLLQFTCGKDGAYSIPSSVTCIGEWAFSDCRKLTSLTIPNSVTSIRENAFSYCGLTSLSIPNSVTSIEKFAFNGCRLTAVTLPSSITCIRDQTFGNCGQLTAVTLPSSITCIERLAFNNCQRLKTVTSHIENVKGVQMGDRVFKDVPTSSCELLVPKGKEEAYRVASQWKEFKNIRAISPPTAIAPSAEPLCLHPNPTASSIYLEAQGEVNIYNDLGQLVLSRTAFGPIRIDLSHLPSGHYIVCAGKKVATVVKK